MSFWKWSRTAASNATADGSINYAEGQSPSSLNDSGRAVMAAAAKYRDDIAGAITTGGTSTAYTVSSYQSFDTRPHLSGNMIAFTPHTTNGATVTLNVDGLGDLPLRSAPSTELSAGVLVQGTPYLALYNNTNTEFYLHGYFGSSLVVPIGTLLDYVSSTAPNSNFALAYGQAVSRTTYATLFALTGTTHGAGDGTTTFNLPDLRGRVAVGLDNMGGTSASRVTLASSGITGTAIGAVGGLQGTTLTTGNLPAYTPAGTIPNLTISTKVRSSVAAAATLGSGTETVPVEGGGQTGSSTTIVSPTNSALTFTGTAQGGSSAVFTNMPPSIILPKILRII